LLGRLVRTTVTAAADRREHSSGRGFLERDNAVNTVGAEDAELAFVITAKVDETAATLTRARQRHLVNRSDALPVFIFKQDNRLTCHGC
jgi:hypothetical protein